MAEIDMGDFEYMFKVLIIGDSGVGKSSFLSRFVDNAFSQAVLQTVGVDFKTKVLTFRKRNIKLQIWDTAGQERFKTITGTFYRGAMGILLMFDITEITTFQNTTQWIDNIRDKCSAEDDPALVIVGNKSDHDSHRKVTEEQGQQLADLYGAVYVEASARTGDNVEEAFLKLVEAILIRKSLIASMAGSTSLSKSIKLTKDGNKETDTPPRPAENSCC